MTIRVEAISKTFFPHGGGEETEVIRAIDLEVACGEVVGIFGPNGCGKSTLLNIVANVDTPTTGRVTVDDEEALNGAKLGYAFQNYRETLLPWQSAIMNVSFGLRARGVSDTDAQERAHRLLDRLGVSLNRDAYPYKLSSGQQQIVALAGVLIQSAANLLLDEPFSALDHGIRFRMQEFLGTYAEETGTATLMISHDIDELLFVSNKVILLGRRPSHVVQTFSVPFARPRTRDLFATTPYAEFRREVMAAILREVLA